MLEANTCPFSTYLKTFTASVSLFIAKNMPKFRPVRNESYYRQQSKSASITKICLVRVENIVGKVENSSRLLKDQTVW